MEEISNLPAFNKYFRVISPSEIDINKEDIFYRDKYNDIMNYVRIMLTNYNDLLLNTYLIPKGALLININSGTDIIDFLKLISHNYYLDILELNFSEINKSPEEFLDFFGLFIESFQLKTNKEKELKEKKAKTENYQEIKGEQKEKKLLLINEVNRLQQLLNERSLLKYFLNSCQDKAIYLDFIHSNVLLVWIYYNFNEISEFSNEIFQFFDILINVPLINKAERETVLRNFLEKNPKIVFDINEVITYTENWEIKDILQLLKLGIFKQFLNSDLNETSNEITDILVNLINSAEYIPSLTYQKPIGIEIKNQSEENQLKSSIILNNEDNKLKKINDINTTLEEIRQSNISELMLNQLYENAASKNYTELVLIIDKLKKKEPLEDTERKILGKYPFVLNDAPNRALINLEKAKKKVDQIKQAFTK